MKLSEIRAETRWPAIIADRSGIVTEVNEAFTKAFGWQRDEIVGKALVSVIPKKLRDTHRLGFSRFLRTGRPVILNQPLELGLLRKDGREVSARHRIVAEREGGDWVFGATIEPL